MTAGLYPVPCSRPVSNTNSSSRLLALHLFDSYIPPAPLNPRVSQNPDAPMVPDKLPKVPLGHFPTPLEELTRLSDLLDGPRILIKRDDLSGLALGGNKVRKLEYLVGDAMSRGADTLVTAGAIQSNHCRQTAAAARTMRAYMRIAPWREGARSTDGKSPPGQDAGRHSSFLGGRTEGGGS